MSILSLKSVQKVHSRDMHSPFSVLFSGVFQSESILVMSPEFSGEMSSVQKLQAHCFEHGYGKADNGGICEATVEQL